MKKIILLMLLVFSITLVFSQKIDNTDLKVTHGPYLQNISGSGVTIVFTTNLPAIPGINLTTTDGTGRFIRNSRDGIIDGGGTVHKVRIEGLEAGKAYKYRVNAVQVMKYQAYKIYYGDTINGREEAFSTPAIGDGKVSFTVINDVHENSDKMGSYLRTGNKDSRDVIFYNGDMVDFLQDEEELFPAFIDTAVHYFAKQKAFNYVRGNHETRGYRARELKQYFDFMNDRYYYSFDRGPVHFIVLDCGEDKPDNNRYYYGLADYDNYRAEELAWLKEEVKSPAFRNASKRIVIIHMPIVKGEKQGHGMKYLSENFGPVLEKAGIDLMISGHTHRHTWYDKKNSGFGYNVLVNSANSYVEVEADEKMIRATVKDIAGKVINTYEIN
jgi:acid phosphatase type 7